MPRNTLICCDKCNRRISATDARLTAKLTKGRLPAIGKEIRGDELLDLCGPCAADLNDWIGQRPAPRHYEPDHPRR